MESQNITFYFFVPVVIIFLDYIAGLTPNHFIARKAAHMTLGIFLLHVQLTIIAKLYILLVSCYAIFRCFYKPFGFGTYADPGIIIYNAFVAFWASRGFAFSFLKPVFFADPMAALIGNLIPTPVWYLNKTVLGSSVCWIVCFISIDYLQFFERLLLSTILTIAEALGGKIDNGLIALLIFVYNHSAITKA